MAATWQVQITVLDVDHRQISVTATRTAGENVAVYSIPQATIRTTAEKVAVLDAIWAQHTQAVATAAAVAAVVADLESAAKANLEAREA